MKFAQRTQSKRRRNVTVLKIGSMQDKLCGSLFSSEVLRGQKKSFATEDRRDKENGMC
jgi:hypothetical protein